jgi:hypothetical protein
LVGVTSLIQGQIDSKADDNHDHTLSDITDVTVSATEINYLEGVTSSVQDQIDGKAVSNHTHTLVDITDITASAVELNVLDGMTALTSELNVLDGIEVSTSELNHLSGVTSSVQDQIDGKANSTHTHNLGDIVDVSATVTEINYVSGVTSSIQNQIDSKASTTHVHSISDVTGLQTELDAKADETHTHAISDVTNLQTSLDAKANLAGATFTGDLEIPNVTITGNLLVQGTTTTINTTDYAIRDNMIYMNQAGMFTVTNAVGSGTAVTYTAPNHDFVVGDYIVITGITPSGYNIAGASLLTIDSVSGDDFVVTKTDTGTYVSGGTARGKSAANPDLGFAAGRTTTNGYGHTGLFRDATDATWKFFDGYTPEPDESLYIDTAHETFSLSPIATSAVTTGNITATGTVDLTSATVSGISLDDLSDAAITSAETGDVLYYNGSSWVNRYINSIPAKSASPSLTSNNYNLASTDAGMIIEISNSVAATVTIPSDESFAVGTQMVILQTGAGEVSVNVQSPAVQNLNYSPGNKLRGQWSAATLLKRASSTWVLYGDLAE